MAKVDSIVSSELSRAVVRQIRTDESNTTQAVAQQAGVSVERQVLTEGGKISPLHRARGEAEEVRKESREAVETAVEEISNYVQSISRELRFSVDEELGSTVVTVLNDQTQEVIRQIPSEELVELAKRLDEQVKHGGLVRGLLVSSEA